MGVLPAAFRAKAALALSSLGFSESLLLTSPCFCSFARVCPMFYGVVLCFLSALLPYFQVHPAEV